jgi:hypothetical protein
LQCTLSERPIPNILAIPRAAISFLFRHPWLTFLLLGACFLLFGVTSVNLFVLLMNNVNLFIEYGVMVIDDGALRQLAELVGLACLSGILYVGFAVCDRTLLRRLTGEVLRECGRELSAQTRRFEPSAPRS